MLQGLHWSCITFNAREDADMQVKRKRPVFFTSLAIALSQKPTEPIAIKLHTPSIITSLCEAIESCSQYNLLFGKGKQTLTVHNRQHHLGLGQQQQWTV